MPRRKLSDGIVAARMVELRNLRRLHAHDRKQIVALKAENKAIQTENVELRQMVATLQIQVAGLQTMVFGKKKRPPMGGTPIGVPDPFSPAPVPRTKDSYRRLIPPASAVTSEVAVLLPESCVCGGNFDPESVTMHERYEEDIPLPELTPGYIAHLVAKYTIERGICLKCGKAITGGGRDLGGARVGLGSNVRLLVCHLVAVVGMSYSQVAGLLLAPYGLAVTDGELANMLRSQHIAWLPKYDQLKADIRAAPVVHADETPWPIQNLQGAGYAWNMSDASSPKVYFALEQSRGAVHAQTKHPLFGQGTDNPFTGVRISDDYSPYHNPKLPGTQQLCWAHLYRTVRDLRYNANLPEEQLPYVQTWYETFAAVYQDLRQYLGEPYDEVVRGEQSNELWQRLQTLTNSTPDKHGEPDKLTSLKARLQRAGQARLFACLHKSTPCDNNRAERDLRQLVLKRKRSFGSKTEKGAQALATILSLCTTTWRTAQPQNYFPTLASLA